MRALIPAVAALMSTASPHALAETPSEAVSLGGTGTYVHGIASLGYGLGLRFNNPYRLQTQLGDDADGLSLTSGYLDLGVGAAFGNARGFQHGAVAHLSLATQGVTQEVVSLGYLSLLPLGRHLLGMGRVSVPLVLEPDFGSGVELGAGAVYYLAAGLGLSAELLGSVFFGAATWENDPTVWPILSLQLGVVADYEVLP